MAEDFVARHDRLAKQFMSEIVAEASPPITTALTSITEHTPRQAQTSVLRCTPGCRSLPISVSRQRSGTSILNEDG